MLKMKEKKNPALARGLQAHSILPWTLVQNPKKIPKVPVWNHVLVKYL